jgi:hypothetical protein
VGRRVDVLDEEDLHALGGQRHAAGLSTTPGSRA